MNTKAFRRKLTAAIGAITACATLTCGGVGAAHAEERDTLGDSVLNAYNALNGNSMRFEKVSHPQAGLRAADGVVDYIGNGMITEADKGQGDRGQSSATPPHRTVTGCTSAPCTAALACRRS